MQFVLKTVIRRDITALAEQGMQKWGENTPTKYFDTATEPNLQPKYCRNSLSQESMVRNGR